MLPWVSLLVLAPISGQLEATPKSVISLRPPWTVVFKGEKVTLTCNGFHLRTSQKTTWHREHHGRKELHETLGNTLEVQEPGEYRCQVQGSLLSSRVALLFSQALLILGAPFAVFEGDPVVLQCRVKREAALETLHLHKNGKPMYTSGKIPDVYIPHASLKDNGAYHCTGVKKDDSPVSSNTVKIQVQELFPQPVLKASPSWPTEGGPLTLTCQTQLAPQRSDVQLWFRFFRDGQTLGSRWSNSPEFQITAVWSRDSRSYWCQAKRVTSRAGKTSQELQINVKIPVSQPVLTLSPPGAQAAEGEVVTLHCKVPRGSFPITYQLYHEGVPLKKEEGSAQRAMPFRLPLTAERSGHYFCSADNGFGPRCSEAVGLSVIVPVSRPVLTLRAPGAQAVVGDVLELRCEAQRGSPPILYRFYHEDVALGSSSAPSGGGASINLSLTAEHSGNYSCEADNALRTQRSNTVSLSVTVPVSRPVLTLGAPGAQAAVGDVLELRCEAQRGSPPILYRFYHEGVALESSSTPSGGGASFNLSLTADHSGNFSCEADNGLGSQRSEAVPLKVTGLTANRSGLTATGVAGGLVSLAGLAALALVSYCRLSGKAGGRPTSGPSRSSSDSNSQEPTYHNVPGWVEMQPVYSNVNPQQGEVIYSEVRGIQKKNSHAAASSAPGLQSKDSSVIYAQVKRASAPACRPQLLASSAPHR
ncbi:Fc receptor-like protein 5 isoform X4 [Manis pentadactyla]|uniref:Fc receptor-like protein 5 isoform X4 n=1 Tax=Manis pentadactyla TaxID=143292 RepID=UPI00255CD6BC|nr:Fc receptor-like protein 5 isoform X4 [Manis pentadactyla]